MSIILLLLYLNSIVVLGNDNYTLDINDYSNNILRHDYSKIGVIKSLYLPRDGIIIKKVVDDNIIIWENDDTEYVTFATVYKNEEHSKLIALRLLLNDMILFKYFYFKDNNLYEINNYEHNLKLIDMLSLPTLDITCGLEDVPNNRIITPFGNTINIYTPSCTINTITENGHVIWKRTDDFEIVYRIITHSRLGQLKLLYIETNLNDTCYYYKVHDLNWVIIHIEEYTKISADIVSETKPVENFQQFQEIAV